MSSDANAKRELPPASYSAPGRDPVITTPDGCRIYLHIHDGEYMRQRAEWKRRLSAAHPDHGGSASAFRSLIGQRTQWQLKESLYYAKLGLLPPDNWGENLPSHQDIRARAIASAQARLNPIPPRVTGRAGKRPHRDCDCKDCNRGRIRHNNRGDK